jgi:hypothetical protein
MEQVISALERQIRIEEMKIVSNRMERESVESLPGYKGPALHTENQEYLDELRKAVAILKTPNESPSPTSPKEEKSFQQRVDDWLLKCFGEEIARDKTERNHRFLEESLELVQSLGCTRSEAHQLVDYVFDRPDGETAQECGGVMVTLAALCLASNIDMDECGEIELKRIWANVEKIRAKQAAKPKHSPLPQNQTPKEEKDPKIFSAIVQTLQKEFRYTNLERVKEIAERMYNVIGLDGTFNVQDFESKEEKEEGCGHFHRFKNEQEYLAFLRWEKDLAGRNEGGVNKSK